MQSKAELRKLYLARRRAILTPDRAGWNADIQVRVLALPELQGRDDVYIYVATDDEVETRGIIRALLDQGRRVLTPIGRDDGQMDWGQIASLDSLHPGRFGMLEPTAVTQRAEDPHRGIAIVPCVAFTSSGNRLGRGGGHYDRFLAGFIGETAVALAYDVQRVEYLPHDSHDIRVSCVVTESGFLKI